ncbi:hypothetical protein RB195_015798 [Necator americanus]|uniref:Endonuclease/exonuclease/phosphatase domain-containing protein n=1 Tax=Necator americanus TaxID=51031 RepID=A0ABR1E670_NECAM
MRSCGSTPALTVLAAYAPTLSYEEEKGEALFMDLEKLYRGNHAFTIGDFNVKIGLEECLSNFASGPTAYNGMNKGRGSPSSS